MSEQIMATSYFEELANLLCNIHVTTAKEMYNAVMQSIVDTDIFISAAAVADYGLQTIAEQKIKKTGNTLELILEKNPDILAEVAALNFAPFTVGFAAETENLDANAQIKMKSKRLDMIAANLVGDSLGFDSDMNALTIFWQSGQKQFQEAPKEKLARHLIKLVAEKYNEKNTSQTH